MSEEKLSYQEAKAELEQILNDLESEEVNVDELSKKIKRASLLFSLCKAKLLKTEEEVNIILKDLFPNE